MKKSQWISAALMLIVTIGVYFLIYQEDIDQKIKNIDSKKIATSEGLISVFIQTDKENIKLGLKDEKWWIEVPYVYPASEEFVERSLTVMNQVLADAVFPLKEDQYGFKESFLALRLSYKDGNKKELILGTKEAPGSQIYLLDSFTKNVYVVHNVWAQFFYYDAKTFLSSNLPIKDWDVWFLEWKEKGKQGWLAKKEGEFWSIQQGDKSYKIKNNDLLWWLKSIKNMNVKPTQFNKDNPGSDIQLTIKGATEEETLQWSRDKGEIYISSLKAFAEVDPFSLKSIELELNKVIESAKK